MPSNSCAVAKLLGLGYALKTPLRAREGPILGGIFPTPSMTQRLVAFNPFASAAASRYAIMGWMPHHLESEV